MLSTASSKFYIVKLCEGVVLVVMSMEERKGYACTVTGERQEYHRKFQSLNPNEEVERVGLEGRKAI